VQNRFYAELGGVGAVIPLAELKPAGPLTVKAPVGSPRKPRRPRHRQGQTLVEYALILAFISLVAIAVLIKLGTQVKSIFTTITTQLASANSSSH
jgi:Flp pilus assembly pilin Flp